MYIGDSHDTRQFRKIVADFLAVETEQGSDRRVYLSCVVLGSILVYFFGGTPWMFAAIPPYILVEVTYGQHARRAAQRTLLTQREYLLLRLHHLATIVAFAVLVNVIAFTPGIVSAWAAGLLVFGMALNCVSHETRSAAAGHFGMFAVGFVALSAAFGISTAAEFDARTKLFVVLSTLMLALYFGRVVVISVRIRENLVQRTDALRHAQKGEAVGRLTSGIAHDFNNLLTVMRGNIDLLTEVPESERGSLIQEIGAATDRGGRLVGQLLASVRRGERSEEVVELCDFLSTFTAFARRVLPANVELQAQADGDLRLRCDAAQLDSALLNLVVNARDAMPDGGIVSIVAETIEPSSAGARGNGGGMRWIMISVIDDGPGMPPDVLARATEPFMTTKPAGMGTGLGLSMVREFADRMGGKFELQSEIGRGTAARLRLPA